VSRAHGVSEQQLHDLPRYHESPAFSPLERSVLDLAVAMAQTPVEVPPALVTELRQHLDQTQLVELAAAIAWENTGRGLTVSSGSGRWGSPPERGARSQSGHRERRMDKPRLVRRLLPIQNRAINPLVCAAIERGLAPPTYALLETTGRRTARPRLVPVANGLDGDTFWLIAALGDQANYVRNLRADPRVRVKARPARLRDGLRMRWRAGTAHPMPEDDARARHHRLGRRRPGYRLDGILLRALAIDMRMLTIRVELDPPIESRFCP